MFRDHEASSISPLFLSRTLVRTTYIRNSLKSFKFFRVYDFVAKIGAKCQIREREYLRDDSQVDIRALGECVTTRAIRGSPYTRDRDTCDIIPTGNATDVFDCGAISPGIETTVIFP